MEPPWTSEDWVLSWMVRPCELPASVCMSDSKLSHNQLPCVTSELAKITAGSVESLSRTLGAWDTYSIPVVRRTQASGGHCFRAPPVLFILPKLPSLHLCAPYRIRHMCWIGRFTTLDAWTGCAAAEFSFPSARAVLHLALIHRCFYPQSYEAHASGDGD